MKLWDVTFLIGPGTPTPVLLPGKSHGQRSLIGCSPWGCKESDMTERLDFHFSLSCVGEGNGNPLQCSCLENPRDGGACWAAIYGVAQSRTRLKWLSSSRAGGVAWLSHSLQTLIDFSLQHFPLYPKLDCLFLYMKHTHKEPVVMEEAVLPIVIELFNLRA